jgi:hypothetical protein
MERRKRIDNYCYDCLNLSSVLSSFLSLVLITKVEKKRCIFAVSPLSLEASKMKVFSFSGEHLLNFAGSSP